MYALNYQLAFGPKNLQEILPEITHPLRINRFSETHPNLLNETYVLDNVAIVNIFFKDQHFMRHERSELFGITDFFANIGGLMGLCMGFSILSLVEFLYFFSLRLILHIQGRNSKVRTT